MLRPAVPADLPSLLAIRAAAGVDALSDPALVAEADLRRFIAAHVLFVWEDEGSVAGFFATEGTATHLLVASEHRSKGIGRELLAASCVALRAAGHAEATLTLVPGSTAERHYRAAGWAEAGRSPTGGAVLKKPF
jgi:GNAT superfamily N-acetyltransferase